METKNEMQEKVNFFTEVYWTQFCEIFPKLVKFDPPTVKLCGRLTVTAGKAYQPDNRIHLGSKFLAKYEDMMLLQILPHEIAHIVDFVLNGPSEKYCGHGKKWVEIMVQFGIPADKYHLMGKV